MKDFLSQAGELLKKRKQYKRQTAVFLCLAVIVAFGTVTALKLYGQAMTHKVDVLACNYEVHEHTEDCYEEDAEGSRKLVCGYADYVIHVHNDSCYDADGNLVCALEEHEEHKHTEDCYKTERILVCGEETEGGSAESAAGASAQSTEGMAGSAAAAGPKSSEEPDASRQQSETVCGKEAHKHDESCYEKNLVCGKEEHTHDESCMHHELNCELAEHAHDAGCYDEAGNVVCGQEEHAHEIGCYDAEGNLICKQEHEHFAGCYINTFECGKENHTHSDECYEESLACEMEEHEHTDACFAQAGAESAASTKSVSAEEEGAASAEPAGHVHTDACYEEVTTLVCGELELHTHDDSCYTEDCFDEEGDLIEGSRPSCGLLQLEEHTHTKDCFKTVELTPEEVAALNNGAKLHVHTDECYDEEGKLICGHEETHIHDASCYDEDGNVICGHNLQTEPENEKTCEGSGYSVKVTYPDSAEIPEEAELIVRQITEESDPERFAQRQAEARETLENENISVHALFDIGFYVDGQEIEPKDTVNVTIQLLDENGLPEGTPMQIVHFAESGNEVLESGDIDSEGNASFETDSFSEFMMVSAFGSGNIAIITTDGPESDEVDGNLICGKEEHTHGEGCNGADGNLICGKEEHTHDLTCLEEKEREEVEKVNELIAALPDQEEIARKTAEYEEKGEEGEEALGEYTEALLVQIQEAYESYLGLDEALRGYVTGADYLLAIAETMGVSLMDEETANQTVVPSYAAFLPIGEQGEKKSGLALKLLYSRGQEHDELPEGEEDYPVNSRPRKGFFTLYPVNIGGFTQDTDVKVSLYFPAEYVDKSSISITPPVEMDGVKYEITAVEEVKAGEEEELYYKVSFIFKNYTPSSTQFLIPFSMKFTGPNVPREYKLNVFGAIKVGDESVYTSPNIYRPKYEDPKIVKYVNTNKYESMQLDNTEVIAQINKDGTLEEGKYVSFWYKMSKNNMELRGYEKIILVDKLPTYIGKDEQEHYAVFDEAVNPGWVEDKENHTVSYTFDRNALEDENNKWVLEQCTGRLIMEINQTELKLRFPDCKIDDELGEYKYKDLNNYVEAHCYPIGRSESEKEYDTCYDNIWFRLINKPGEEGDFAKSNSAEVITDTKDMRSAGYRWGLDFTNNDILPFKNIVIADTEIDSRLKFQKIVFVDLKKNETKRLKEHLDYVEAVTYNGETIKYDLSNESTYGDYFKNTGRMSGLNAEDTWTLELDSSHEYKSFTIYFKPDFELNIAEGVTVYPYSTFWEPDTSKYEAEEGKNTYINKAKVTYNVEGQQKSLESENSFRLIPVYDDVWIEKEMLSSDLEYPSKKTGADGNVEWDYEHATTACIIRVKGSLQDDVEYDDLRVVDLLPEALELPDDQIIFGTGGELVTRTEVFKDYKRTGRTAVIFWLDANKVRALLGNTDPQAPKPEFNFNVRVQKNASPGQFTNDAYLLSDKFGPLSETTKSTRDYLDLNGNQSLDELIRWDDAVGSIATPEGVYAQKYIARKGSNDWKRVLQLKSGDEFQYKLTVSNALDEELSGLKVYDVLPKIGDYSINGKNQRGSEFAVKLTGPVVAPEGYKVFYTESQEVYGMDMESLLVKGEIVWSETVTESVTAFKIVADGETILAKGSTDFIVPVKVALSQESYGILRDKEEYGDGITGTAAYLEAVNSFGYIINDLDGQNMESNYVMAQVPFAGFVIRKEDDKGKWLPGAEFKLEKLETVQSESGTNPDNESMQLEGVNNETPEDADRNSTMTGTTDSTGMISFRDLTEGTYLLTETKAPVGYNALTDSITITITQDPVTREYTVTTDLEGSGTSENPFVVINEPSLYQLPETGGTGTTLYTMAGAAFLTLGAGFLYKKKFRERRT